jgi:hypothetical protein
MKVIICKRIQESFNHPELCGPKYTTQYLDKLCFLLDCRIDFEKDIELLVVPSTETGRFYLSISEFRRYIKNGSIKLISDNINESNP